MPVDANTTDQEAVQPSLPLYIGSAGWSYRDWSGIVYPSDAPRDFDPLVHMLRWVKAIEINTSFYNIPMPRTVESWARRVESHPDFRFTMKAWQGFTHGGESTRATPRAPGIPPADRRRGAVRAQREAAEVLQAAGKLGCLLFQFPYAHRFTREHLDELLRLLDDFEGFECAVEFRHRSWLGEEVMEELAARRIAFCNIDQPIIGDNIPPTSIVTAPLRYIRMHGRNREAWFARESNVEERYSYLYSEEELHPWIEKAVQLCDGADAVYFIFNNHGQGQGLTNAIMSEALVAEVAHGKRMRPPAPDLLARRYPVLRGMAALEPTMIETEKQMDIFSD